MTGYERLRRMGIRAEESIRIVKPIKKIKRHSSKQFKLKKLQKILGN